MEKVLSKKEFMDLVYKGIEQKENERKKGIKAAEEHMHDNYAKIRKHMRKYKKSYKKYD